MRYLGVSYIVKLWSSARSGGSHVCPLVSWKQFGVAINPGAAGAPLLYSLVISDVARPRTVVKYFQNVM